MTTIKRTSPGPKIGPTGNTKGGAAKSIGTTGPDKTSKSTAGGQHPFMPAPKSSASGASRGSGQHSSPRSDNMYDFMPRKAGGK